MVEGGGIFKGGGLLLNFVFFFVLGHFLVGEDQDP